ncbi:hypothetical protein BGZ97_011927 [Linnemannia gamsii]|uniref:Secreted protein n=1 Tax=Linnemannia gamsii TaxID=64522 RepID=A0A9P6R6J7_9FUNG|nr:hypothetical protein BGZ97_011927 [Linnemannia gamsii]
MATVTVMLMAITATIPYLRLRCSTTSQHSTTINLKSCHRDYFLQYNSNRRHSSNTLMLSSITSIRRSTTTMAATITDTTPIYKSPSHTRWTSIKLRRNLKTRRC